MEHDRLQLLHEAKDGNHAVGCCGSWLRAAIEVLHLNGVDAVEFTADIRNSLENGRGKGRNLYIWGESNCAKSFMLMPLLAVYGEERIFMSPADNKFNWVGANTKDAVFLNDLNYSEEGVMKWGPFLNLLEGAPVHISAPKNHFAEDTVWRELTPIFATAQQPILRVVGGVVNRSQTKMMDMRWKFYHFTHEFKPENVVRVPNCGKCFAELVLEPESVTSCQEL